MATECSRPNEVTTAEGVVRPNITQSGLYTLAYEPFQIRSQALICGPLAHEGVIAVRSLNYLARLLAKSSIASLRFDYEGTGESAGYEFTPETMVANRQEVAQQLALRTQPRGAIGARFGAYPALFGSGPMEDFLVLWDPVVCGKTYAQAIRIDSKRHMFRRFAPWAPAEFKGFTYTRKLLSSFSQLNLTACSHKTAERILIVAQEKLEAIDELAERLVNLGSEVTVIRHNDELIGSGSLVTIPSATAREIASWI